MSSQQAPDYEIAPQDDVRPCKHMEGMVSSLADGSLHGPARWYTQFHAMHCIQCKTAVKQLRAVIDRVSVLREEAPGQGQELPMERRAELEHAMDEVDGSAKGKG
jgi:hypothetical protein